MHPITWSVLFVATLSAALPAAMPDMGKHVPEWAAFGEPGRAPGRTITVTATDTRYEPDKVRIKRGETVRFVITNRGHGSHEFVIGDAAFQAQHQREMAQMPDMKMDEPNEVTLRPGQTRILSWRFSRAGQFLYACDLPGHAEAGMVGHIYVQ